MIRLRKPWNAAVNVLFAQADYVYGILPKHAFADTRVVGTSWESAPFGSGPFRIKAWLRGDRIVLEPNPYYRPRPKLQQIVLRIVPDLNSNFVALQSGAVDVGTLTAENVTQAERTPGFRVLRIPENATRLLYLQTRAGPTRDIRVRRAIAAALDYRALSVAWRRQFLTGRLVSSAADRALEERDDSTLLARSCRRQPNARRCGLANARRRSSQGRRALWRTHRSELRRSDQRPH